MKEANIRKVLKGHINFKLKVIFWSFTIGYMATLKA